MALGRGIGVMGRGSASTPESLAQRQKLAMQLYLSSLSPQQKETSWTQGAARLAQALASGYEQAQVDKERGAYDRSQSEGMAALLSGDGNITPEVAASLPANQQIYALQMMQDQRKHALQRQEHDADQKSEYEMRKNLMNEDPKNYLEIKQREAMEAINDPNASDEVRRGAEAELNKIGIGKNKALSMTPEDKEISEGVGKEYIESQKDAASAQLQNTRIDAVISNLKNAKPGALFDWRMGGASVLQYLGATPELLKDLNLGDPAAMSAVKSNLLQFAIDEQVRQKGPQTENDFKRYQQAFAQTNETNDQILKLVRMRKALNDRKVAFQDAKEEWRDKYGSVEAKVNGQGFDKTWRGYVAKNPLFGGEE